jgi:desulfoferrodoxin (superoxide reductase-like protein)
VACRGGHVALSSREQHFISWQKPDADQCLQLQHLTQQQGESVVQQICAASSHAKLLSMLVAFNML